MGIWLHTHTHTTTGASPGLWKLAEILPDESVQTMPLHFGWGYRRSFSVCGRAYGFTFTSLPPQTIPRICGSWMKSSLMQMCKPCTTLWLRLKNLPNCIPCPCPTHMMCLNAFSCCGWAYGFTLTPLPPQMFPQICESWLKSYLLQVCKPCHYTLVEAIEPFKLHPMSMSYTYNVFAYFLRLWMGMWVHTHTNTTWDVSPDLWELAEILPDASVQIIPLRLGWGCNTFQTASPCPCHTYMRCLRTCSGCGWAFGFTLTLLPPQMLSQIFESWLKYYLMQVCKPCHYALVEAVEPFKLHPMSISYIYEVFFTPFQVLDRHMAAYSHCYHHRCIPRFVKVGWNTTWCKFANHATMLWLRLLYLSNCIPCPCHTYIWGFFTPSQVLDEHMSAYSHCYHHRGFPIFVKVGWNPTWCKCANHATTLWLRLQNLSNCIPCPCHTYMRCFHTFSGCGWAYIFKFTSLPPQPLPQICESWLKFYLMQVCKPCQYTLVKAVEPFILNPMSMSFIYEVFEYLSRLWMVIWLHPYTITTTDVSPDLWELAEILPDASVQTMPLHFGWGCRTFQTASHVHIIHIWEVWLPSQVVDGHMASHSHRYHHRHFPRVVWVGWNPPDASVQTMPLHFGWGCRTFQTASHVHVIHKWCVCLPS